MYREFIDKKKFLDYFNVTNREVLISIFLTLILLVIEIKIDIYNNFSDVRVPLQNITIYVASGLLALIGIILTGLALMLGLLDRKLIKEIYSIDKNVVNDLMICFKFLIANLGFACILFFFAHFMLFVYMFIPRIIFYIIFSILVYYFIFLVFYTIDLISTSIDLYLIRNINDETDILESTYKQNKLNNYIDKIKLEYLMRDHNARSSTLFFSSIDKIIEDIKDIDDVERAKLKKVFRELYDKKHT